MRFSNKNQSANSTKLIFVQQDRYCGGYSGHAYTAWNYGSPIISKPRKHPSLYWGFGVPDEACGDDEACWKFWEDKEEGDFPLYGGGNTPEEAVLNFLSKLREIGVVHNYQHVIIKEYSSGVLGYEMRLVSLSCL